MASTNTTHNTQAFYRLKVEDALSYLDQVKLQFARQPDVYNQFLDIMKEFKSQSIDTPGVISRVSNLFRGHADLIEGFNTFLPPGYKIEVQGNDSVHVTSPSSAITTIATSIQNTATQSSTASITAGTAGSNRTTQASNTNTLNNLQAASAAIVNINSLAATGNAINIQLPNTSHIKIEQGIPTMLNGNLPQNASINLPTNSKLFANQIPPATTPPLATPTTTVAPLMTSKEGSQNQSTHPTQQVVNQFMSSSQPQITQVQSNATTLTQATSSHNTSPNQVEFGHAISYVNKIKHRFQNQPDIYKAFLEILHTYQKQQKNLKDGVFTGQALSESEVYAKVAKLFKNQEDLLNEFSQFLPDANSNATATATATAANNTNTSSMQTTGTASSSSSSVAAGTANTTATAPSTLNETTNLTTSKYLQQQQHESPQQSTITTKTEQIATTQSKTSQNKANTQANTPSTAKTSKYSSKQLKSQQANQENTMGTTSTTNTSTTTSTSSNKNLISNMSSSKSSVNSSSHHNHLHQYGSTPTNTTSKTSSHTITSTGSVKRASSNHQLSSKKQKLSSLKHSSSNNSTLSNTNYIQTNTLNAISTNSNYNLMPIHDADYINSINEVTFFEHVKKALRTTEVYKNFLRCIALFNQEIVNRQELIKVVEPYLGKFPELYRWFKNYVDDKDDRDRLNETLTNKSQANKERIDLPFGDNFGDNLTLEIDYSSCKQYGTSYREISTPYSQSNCSGRTELCKEVLNDTFVSFPCWSEDSTFVTSKKNQHEELLFRTEDERFELDVILETNLATIRVLEGVQKKMMKMSADERNKFRLDNCLGGSSEVIHFKAIQRIYGDKSKEFIEGIKRNPAVAVPLVLKRLKAKDEEWKEAKKNFEKQWREQIEKNYLKSLDYCAVPFKQTDQKHLKTRSLLTDIETIYFERQEAKEEGQEIPQTPHLTFKYDDKSILEDAAALIIHHVKRQMGIQKEDKQKIKQIVYYFLPDLFFVPRGALSDDEADDEDDDNSSSKKKEKKPARHTDTNKRRLTDVDDRPKDIPEEYKSPEDMYRLFFVNDHWYLFFRYHQILCERLNKIYKHSITFAEQENIDAKNRQKSVAEALKLRNKCKIDTAASEYYPAFLDIVRNLLDGSIDGCQYEDTLREMFGIHAYIAFTLDKVVQNCVRQLQYLVQDESCAALRHYYLDEQKTNSTGGKVANMQSLTTQNSESAYQRKVESLLQDQNCFKILMYKNSGRLTVELLDTETQDNLNENEMNDIEKWSEYIEKYYSDENNQISDDLKEGLLSKPVFLTRNAHLLKQKFQDDDKKDNLEIVDNTVYKLDSTNYKIRYEPNTWSVMYRKNALKNARKCHHSVTKGMYDSFKKHLNKWLKENSITTDSIDDWLVGETLDNPNIKTTCSKDCSLKRTPYHVIYKYKTQQLNVNSNTNTTTTLTTTTTKSKEKIKDKISNQNNNENNITSNDNTTNTINTQQQQQQNIETNDETINKTN